MKSAILAKTIEACRDRPLPVTGMVVDLTGSFVVALAIGAGITIPGAVILHIGVRDPIAPDALESDRSGASRAVVPAAKPG